MQRAQDPHCRLNSTRPLPTTSSIDRFHSKRSVRSTQKLRASFIGVTATTTDSLLHSTCLISPSGGVQSDPLLLYLRRKVGVLAPLPGQRPGPISEGVLDHLEDVTELLQAFLSGLGFLALPLYCSLQVFD